jgi:hypothetical protein
LPAIDRDNGAQRYGAVLSELKRRGLFPALPFGSEMTEHEIVLARALRGLKEKIESARGTLEAMAEAVVDGSSDAELQPYLERMGLANPQTLMETVYQRLLSAELRQVLTHAI